MNEAERNQKRLAAALKRKELRKTKDDPMDFGNGNDPGWVHLKSVSAAPLPSDDPANHFHWIKENLRQLSAYGSEKFKEHGRGAIVCDLRGRPGQMRIWYSGLADVPASGEAREMVQMYSPDEQLVVVFLKPQGIYAAFSYVVQADRQPATAATVN